MFYQTLNMNINRKSKFVKVSNQQNNTPARDIHEAFEKTLDHQTLSRKQIAFLNKLSPQFLANTCNKNLHIKFALRRLIPLIKSTGNPAILEFIAKELGFFIFQIPETKAPGSEKMLGLIFKLKNKWEQISCLLEKHYGGGEGDKNLLRDIEEQLWVLINIAAALRVSVFNNIDHQFKKTAT